MSPQTKYNTKWLLGITATLLSILLLVVTTTARVTTRFNKIDTKFVQNNNDHNAIIRALEVEVATNAAETQRSIANDERENEAMGTFSQEQTEMRSDIKHLIKSVDEIKQEIKER